MTQQPAFHMATVGWDHALVEGLCDAIAAREPSALLSRHASSLRQEQNGRSLTSSGYLTFFAIICASTCRIPIALLLASLEQADLPTIHNMILGDRVVRQTQLRRRIGYATFLARRLDRFVQRDQASVIIGGFDAIHGSLALAVARRMNIPWFALHFSVIPPGLACFCNRMSPAARVPLTERDLLRDSAHSRRRRCRNSRQEHSGAGLYCTAASCRFRAR